MRKRKRKERNKRKKGWQRGDKPGPQRTTFFMW